MFFNRAAISFPKSRACAASIKQICSIYVSGKNISEEEHCLQSFKLFNFILDSLQLVVDENIAGYVRAPNTTFHNCAQWAFCCFVLCCGFTPNRDPHSFSDDVHGLLRAYSSALVEPYWNFCCRRVKVLLENSLGRQIKQSLMSLIHMLVRLIDSNKGRARRASSDLFWLFDLLIRYRCYLPTQQLSIFVYRVYQLDDY